MRQCVDDRGTTFCYYLFIIYVLMLFFIAGCSKNSETTSNRSIPQISSNQSSSAAFSIIWPKKSVDNENNSTLSCLELGIVTITVDVYISGQRITEASFDCSDGEGLIENIPAGQNRTFVISGKDFYGNSLLRGERSGIEIIQNEHTDIGFVELFPVDDQELHVISTIPIDQANNVGLRTVISATFSESIDTTTLTSGTFRVNDGDTDIEGEIRCTGATVSFQPSSDLDYNKSYTAILAADIKDIYGKPLAEPFTWSFMSIENIPPTVEHIYPKDASRGVGIFPTISVTFSESMDPVSITTETFLVQAHAENIQGQVTYDESTLTAKYLPNENLPCNAVVTIVLTTGITDLIGNSLILEESSQFTTSHVCGEQIVAGVSRPKAIKADGTLWGWGTNTDGLIGETLENQSAISVQVGNDTKWSTVASGVSFSIALKTDGTLWAWGENDYGELGDGTFESKDTPGQIGTGSDWALISAGHWHSLALKTNGTLWAWGRNTWGATGSGLNDAENTPIQIGHDSDWIAVMAGYYHSLALKTDGTLWSWGNNGSGQLGDGTYEVKRVPVQIGHDSNWTAASGGFLHTVALRDDGTLWAWGFNNSGLLGDGTYETKNLPVQIGHDSDWVAVRAGSFHSVALKNDGTLWAWGENDFGQLGDGTYEETNIPIQVGNDTDWSVVSVGDYYNLALKIDGTLWGWGDNRINQLGDGVAENINVPTNIMLSFSLH